MYPTLFRWFPKSALSRMMGWLADRPWPAPVLRTVVRLYIAAFGIDMADYADPPEAHRSFTAFFTRRLKPGTRPLDPDPHRVVSPVDGAVSEVGRIAGGRLIQAKGIDYGLKELLGGDPAWETYIEGSFVTLYLSPRDYHRIHSPVSGKVTRFLYRPGELWTVSPAGVRTVVGLFNRNERIVTFIAAEFGEVALVAVGATVVGRMRMVYHPITSNRRGAGALREHLDPPYPVERGGELGRFELGSTVICLFRPGEVVLDPLKREQIVRLRQGIGTVGKVG